MTPDDIRQFRDALRTPARWVIADLERRGVTFRVQDGRILARPGRLVTTADRDLLAAHKPAALLLLARRADWSEWALRQVPPFDPSRALLTNDEIWGRSA